MPDIASLSVVVTTYKHEKYIAECLDSILMQQYDHPFEIIVGEDLSPDKTREIVLDYQKRYPDRIKPLLHEKNMGSGSKNFKACLEACSSDWVAWIEGDDYWSDPLKLKKQMALLRDNPNAVLCFSKAQSFDEKGEGFAPGRIFGPANNKTGQHFTRLDILSANVIPTCTIIFKREAAFPFPDWMFGWHLGDWTINLNILKHGTAIFLNEVTAMYRVHSAGAWSTVPPLIKFEKQEKLIKFYIEKETTVAAKKILYLNLFSQQLGLAITYLYSRQWSKIIPKFFDAIRSARQARWSMNVVRFYARRAFQLFSYFIRKQY